MVVSELVGGINPSELEGTDALGAITRVQAHAHTPVVVTSTHTVLGTCSVAGAAVVTASSGCHSNQCSDKNQLQHIEYNRLLAKKGKGRERLVKRPLTAKRKHTLTLVVYALLLDEIRHSSFSNAH